MFSVGDKVVCPYGVKGHIEGFLSNEDVFVKILRYNYIKKGKKYLKEKHYEMHVYGIKLIKKI